MGFIEIPEVQKLQGNEAIKALQYFILALEQDKESKLTEKQQRTLIKIADSLIVSIEEEMHIKDSGKHVRLHPQQDPFAVFRRILPWIPH